MNTIIPNSELAEHLRTAKPHPDAPKWDPRFPIGYIGPKTWPGSEEWRPGSAPAPAPVIEPAPVEEMDSLLRREGLLPNGQCPREENAPISDPGLRATADQILTQLNAVWAVADMIRHELIGDNKPDDRPDEDGAHPKSEASLQDVLYKIASRLASLHGFLSTLHAKI